MAYSITVQQATRGKLSSVEARRLAIGFRQAVCSYSQDGWRYRQRSIHIGDCVIRQAAPHGPMPGVIAYVQPQDSLAGRGTVIGVRYVTLSPFATPVIVPGTIAEFNLLYCRRRISRGDRQRRRQNN